MARRRKKQESNHERWLVSYADLLTLLFAFFVVMFASTQSDHVKAKQISEAVDKALRNSSIPPRLAAILGGAPEDAGRGNTQLRGANNPIPKKEQPPQLPLQLDLTSSLKTLESRLSTEIGSGVVRIHVEERGIVIGLNTQVTFPSGGDAITPSMYPTIAKVADVLNLLPNAIRLEGHTDSVPIYNERFRSNWELSAARSLAMMHLLQDRYHVMANRMAIIGYGDTNAIGDNETEEGRTRNRRVDIVIISNFGMHAEPGKEISGSH
jgi:chemotaxis protein MotB